MSRPLLAIGFLTVCVSSVHAADEVHLFSSFRGNGKDGLHLAYSEDGLKWTALNDDKPFLKPTVGGRLMRDPCIIQGPDGLFHMVWTTSWSDRGIGYANSKDLITWSEQQFVPVMDHEATARNCWAPEITWDPDGEQYVIYWATTLPERFAETAAAADKGWNHRLYYTCTKDFKTYTPTRLFYEPGFNVIDSTIARDGKRWVLITKNETRHPPAKNLHIATSDKATGPWSKVSEPFTPKGLWVEGPTAAKIGGFWYVYFDCYTEHRYGAMRTKDFETWEDVSDQLEVPKGMRHGTVLAVSRGLLTPLLEHPAIAPAPALPALHADPHIACFDDTYYIYPTTDGIAGWKGTTFSCWSSKNLVEWKNEGVILDFGKDLTWADHRAWAPCIARKDGKYCFYYSADQQIGVAVADRPTGPFHDPLGKPLIPKGAFQCQTIDPMVFIDDDQAAFLYFGQGNCNVVRLNEDMISFDPAQVKPITPVGYNEGAFMLKRKGVYYLMWSSYDTRDPRYCVNYATGASPTGPFTPADNNPILQQNGIIKAAGHHSVVQAPGKDEWFIAYHRFHIPDGNGYNREVCLSPMRFESDGSIRAVNVFEPAYQSLAL